MDVTVRQQKGANTLRMLDDKQLGDRASTVVSDDVNRIDPKRIKKLDAEMMKLARNLEFEQAARLRD